MRGRALPLQNLEVVPVIRLGLVGIALHDGPGHPFAHRSLPAPIRGLPRQAVLLPGSTDDLLRVLIHHRSVMLHGGILLLGFDESATNVDDRELVVPYPPEQNLLTACGSIETPLSG